MLFRIWAFLSCLVVFFHLSAVYADETSRPIEELTTITSFDGVKLSAKWTLPNTKPNAVVVIFQGSGNVGSDGDVSGPLLGTGYRGAPAKLSDQIAAKLSSVGVASLRFSKRGFDDSSQLKNQTIPYLISDAKAALLSAKTRFQNTKIAIVGLSEGALLATIVASEQPVDALFLLGLASRPIDEILAYQFLEWPVELARRHLDLNHNGILESSELALLGTNGKFPFLGAGLSGASWKDLDVHHRGFLSVAGDLIPAYRNIHGAVIKLVQTPDFLGWYESLRTLSPFADFANKVSAPVLLYQAELDAQVNWTWPVADAHYFRGATTVRIFPGVGHCFSPMDGMIGEIKTSGPLSSELLQTLAADIAHMSEARPF